MRILERCAFKMRPCQVQHYVMQQVHGQHLTLTSLSGTSENR